MKHIDTSKPVLVTGATGYVAGRLVERLLDAGFTVHATVRDPANTAKLSHLKPLEKQHLGRLKFFKADLLVPGSFREGMKGCSVVFHTASPFMTRVEDPQRDLVDPALLGTRNVLESVDAVETVERVVLTSSVAAIYGDNVDILKAPRGILTEEDWNTSSSLSHNPYYYSKTLAEREAWEHQKRQARWDLVVINPSLVIGPGLNADATSESYAILRQLGDGSMAMGVPDFSIGVVDVRDVAEAHLQAAVRPDANGRHIVSAADVSLLQIAGILRKKYGGSYPFPRWTLPKFVAWLGAPAAGLTRRFISRNVGYPFRADNGKSRQALGLRYRAVDESVVALFEQLVETGKLNARKERGQPSFS